MLVARSESACYSRYLPREVLDAVGPAGCEPTRVPAAASARAVALPMPEDAPVTKADRPASGAPHAPGTPRSCRSASVKILPPTFSLVDVNSPSLASPAPTKEARQERCGELRSEDKGLREGFLSASQVRRVLGHN